VEREEGQRVSTTEDTVITEEIPPKPIDPALVAASLREEIDTTRANLQIQTRKLMDTQRALLDARDEKDRAGYRAARLEKQVDEQKTFRWGLFGSLLVLTILIAAILFGCDRSNDRQHDTIQACVAAGGTWISGTPKECLHMTTGA
jgi:hypothetical protein